MEPASIVGLIGSVTRLAGAAYTSSKALYEFINTVRHAHEDFEELATQLLVLDGVLSSLQTNLAERDHRLKEKQVSCLLEAKVTIEKCKESCDAFKIELQKIMSNSQDGKKSLRDGIKRHFKGKTITDFKVLVESYKSSLSLVLNTVCLQVTQAAETLDES
jgi:RNase adaptor protein for sRNA GlmZ degradation